MNKILITLSVAMFLDVRTVFAEIPASVIFLKSITDKNSETYIFNASYAAIDSKQSAISALEGGDSAKALRILTAALEVVPHYDELRKLRNKSLEAVIKITQEFEAGGEKNCEILIPRYEFLSAVAPDSLNQLKRDVCHKKIIPISKSVFELPPLKIHSNLEEKYHVDLTKSIDFYIQKNTNFPYDDLVLNSFTRFYEELTVSKDPYTQLSFKCDGFTFDPNVTDGKNVTITAQCKDNSAFSNINTAGIIQAELSNTEKRYVENLKELLEIPNGTEKIGTYEFKTSIPLKRKYELSFEHDKPSGSGIRAEYWLTSSMNDGRPRFYIMNLHLQYKNSNKSYPFLVRNNHWKSDYTSTANGRFMVIKNAEVFENDFTRIQFDVPKNGPMTFRHMSVEEVKDLLAISFTYDIHSTFKLYQKYFRKKALQREEIYFNRGDNSSYEELYTHWKEFCNPEIKQINPTTSTSN